jgi:AcrR family transcriptional regulator
MARPKEFDVDSAVEAAVEVFREHGFEGTSAQMLVDAMGIGRQSLYDTFGDKWGIYCAAVKHYSQNEVRAHANLLASCERAIDGIRAMLERVAAEASRPCLGVSATVEFGCSRPDLVKIRGAAGTYLIGAVKDALIKARQQGDVAADLDLDHLATFVMTTISSIRLAARGGAGQEHVSALVGLAMRALR